MNFHADCLLNLTNKTSDYEASINRNEKQNV